MAAAAAIMQPTQPGNVGQPHVSSKSRQPFDPNLLCSKLEAAKLEQDGGKPATRSKRASYSGQGYVPRNAARQFASTTTPLPPDHSSKSSIGRSKSLQVPNKAKLDRVDAHESGMNPKQLMANMSIGMSESEAMGMVEQPRRNESKSKRASLPPTTGTVDSGRATRKGSDAGPLPYKPGDSSHRNSEKRRSLHQSAALNQAMETLANSPHASASSTLPTHQHSLPHPDQYPDFFRKSLDDVPEFRQLRDRDNEMPYLMPMENGPTLENGAAKRPKIPDSHDRNDWSQRSQCSDDMRHLLNRPLMRKKQRAHKAGDAQSKVAEGRGKKGEKGAGGRPDTLMRQKSQGDLPEEEQSVGNEAKMIKQEEKVKRRQSLLNPFRKFLH